MCTIFFISIHIKSKKSEDLHFVFSDNFHFYYTLQMLPYKSFQYYHWQVLQKLPCLKNIDIIYLFTHMTIYLHNICIYIGFTKIPKNSLATKHFWIKNNGFDMGTFYIFQHCLRLLLWIHKIIKLAVCYLKIEDSL